MENEGDEICVLKFKPRSGSQLSNLKSIIDQHFNLPHVQVMCGENGGVVLTGLFDGIPDDVESQDHESFDEILKLIGWVEGCIEFPECSKSIAPKVFDESPNTIERSSDQSVHDELEVLDETSECDVLNENDPLTKMVMKIDDSVENGEEMVQTKLKGEPILMKEFSNSVAHQLFDEMPKIMDSHEIKLDVPVVSRVASFDTVANQPNLLPSNFSPDKVNPQVQKLGEETYVFNLVACLDFYHFDPGGAWSRSLADENDMFDLLNKLAAQEKRMNGYAQRVCFDPGGQLLIPGVSEQHAAMENFYLSFDELVRCTVTLLQLRLGHHFRRPEMMVFDPGGEQLWLIGMVHKYVRKFISNYCLGQLMKQIGQGDYVKLLPVFNPQDKGFLLGELGGLYLSRSEEFSEFLQVVVDVDVQFLLALSCYVYMVIVTPLIKQVVHLVKTLNALSEQGKMMGDHVRILCFDPGGKAMLLVVHSCKPWFISKEWSGMKELVISYTLLTQLKIDDYVGGFMFGDYNYPSWNAKGNTQNAEFMLKDEKISGLHMTLVDCLSTKAEVMGLCTTLIFAFDPGGGFSKFNIEAQCARSSSGYALCLTNRVKFMPRTNPHFDWSAKGKEGDAEFMLKIEKTSEIQLLQLGFLNNTLHIHLHKLLGFLEIIHSEALVKVRLLVGAMFVRRDYILAYLLLVLSIISMIIMRQHCELSFEVLPCILVNQKIASLVYELKVTSSIIKELPCVGEATAAIFDSRIGLTMIFVFDPGGGYFRLIIGQAQKHNAPGLLSLTFVPAFEHAIEGLPENEIRYYLLSGNY